MQYDTCEPKASRMEIILVFRNVFRLMPRNDKMLTISKMSCHATGFNKFIPSGPENILLLHKTTVCALAQHYYVHITFCFVVYRTAAIYTDSKITLDSLRNSNNHNYLIHEIRNKKRSLEVDS